MKGRACAVAVVAALLAGGASCGGDGGGPAEASPQPLDRVRAVLDREREALHRRYDALGSGVGAADPQQRPPDADAYVIVVYLKDHDDVPADPQSVDGVPIRFEVTGAITAR